MTREDALTAALVAFLFTGLFVLIGVLLEGGPTP